MLPYREMPPSTGILGEVTIGPIAPVVHLDSPIPDRPYQAAFSVLDPSGAQVAVARSDAAGKFRVELPPGSYTLRPLVSGRFPHASDQPVTVESGRMARVIIRFDSGIR